ncbi:MAG: nitroreductase family protein [Oscillospiraceae bacterium]
MVFREPLEEIIRRRYSVRTYNGKPIQKQVQEEIVEYIKSLSSPFPAKPSFKLIETDLSEGGARLGTYGMIKNASYYIVSHILFPKLQMSPMLSKPLGTNLKS